MLKVQEELRWGNGFTYKFEFYSVSMKLIFGRVTNVLLMLNNNFTHQIFLLTPVFFTHFVFCVAQLLHSSREGKGCRQMTTRFNQISKLHLSAAVDVQQMLGLLLV